MIAVKRNIIDAKSEEVIMKQVRWYNYIEVAVISIVATIALTFLFGVLGLTDNQAYSEIAQRQFFGHESIAETIGLYCIVSPVVEELIFRFGIFNLMLLIIRRFGIFNNIHAATAARESDSSFEPDKLRSDRFVSVFKLIRGLGQDIHLCVWLTSLLFGIYHMNLVQGLYAFLMGLVITYSYAVYRKFSIPVVAHICANAAALIITYLA
jgi:membrane protease YdiL (CAAX protease family)